MPSAKSGQRFSLASERQETTMTGVDGEHLHDLRETLCWFVRGQGDVQGSSVIQCNNIDSWTGKP